MRDTVTLPEAADRGRLAETRDRSLSSGLLSYLNSSLPTAHPWLADDWAGVAGPTIDGQPPGGRGIPAGGAAPCGIQAPGPGITGPPGHPCQGAGGICPPGANCICPFGISGICPPGLGGLPGPGGMPGSHGKPRGGMKGGA